MAKSMTFTLQDDTEALRLLNNFCKNQKYEKLKLENETKKEFFRRMTIEFWMGEGTQGETRLNFETTAAEYQAMDITSEDL